jgi:hypothetical protein
MKKVDGLKDLLEHVRFVHFTMLIIALLLISASLRDQQSSTARAVRDWDQLRELTVHLAQHNTNIEKRRNIPRSEGWEFKNALNVAGVQIDGQTGRIAQYDSFVGAMIVSRTEERTFFYRPSFRRYTAGTGIESVRDMINFWNEAPYVIRLPAISSKGEMTVTCAQTSQPQQMMPVGWDLSIGEHKLTAGKLDEGSELRGFGNLGADLQKRVYTLYSQRCRCTLGHIFDEDLLIDFRDEYLTELKRGPEWAMFAEMFPDLDILLVDFSDLSLDQADRYLKRESRKSLPPIQLFGASLPANVLPTLGATILVLCQLYFLCHIGILAKWLKALDPADWPPGYLATYPTNSAFAIASVSAACLPPFTLIWQVFASFSLKRGRETMLIAGVPFADAGRADWVIASSTLVLSFVLSAMIFRQLLTIRRSARNSGSSPI